MVRNGQERAGPLFTHPAVAGGHRAPQRQQLYHQEARRGHHPQHHLGGAAETVLQDQPERAEGIAEGRERRGREADIRLLPQGRRRTEAVGRHRRVDARTVLLQQVRDVERHPYQCRQAEGERRGGFAHRQAGQAGSRRECGRRQDDRQGECANGLCDTARRRLVADGGHRRVRKGKELHPARTSGNGQVADHHEYDCQRAVSGQESAVRGREDGGVVGSAVEAGEDQPRPVLPGAALKQGHQEAFPPADGRSAEGDQDQIAGGVCPTVGRAVQRAQGAHQLYGGPSPQGAGRTEPV